MKRHALTETELHALREHRLVEIFLGNANADGIPAYCLAEVTDADGNTGVALILCTGDSFSGLNIWVAEFLTTKLQRRPI